MRRIGWGYAAGACVVLVVACVTVYGSAAKSSTVSGQRGGGEWHNRTVSGSKTNEVPDGGCGKAVIRLGSSPGVVDFRLVCKPEGGKAVKFVIDRGENLNEVAGVIRRVRHRPEVVQGGSVRGYGRCSRRRAEVECSGQGTGTIALKGRLWVPTASQCESRVDIIEPKPLPPCEGDCSAVGVPIREIASVYPKGC